MQQIITLTFLSQQFLLTYKVITLPDISNISEFQTASDFHFCIGNKQRLAAISIPDCLYVTVEDLNL